MARVAPTCRDFQNLGNVSPGSRLDLDSHTIGEILLGRASETAANSTRHIWDQNERQQTLLNDSDDQGRPILGCHAQDFSESCWDRGHPVQTF